MYTSVNPSFTKLKVGLQGVKTIQACFCCGTTLTKKTQRQKTYIQICAPSKDFYQPAHSCSLIKIFPARILDNQGCKFLRVNNGYGADAQADLSYRLVHMSDARFLTLRLINIKRKFEVRVQMVYGLHLILF